jgi:HAMP domain-containing protein
VLSRTDRSRGEIPFALDAEGRLYTSRPEDEAALDELPAIRALRHNQAADEESSTPDWVFVVRHDPASGFRYGIARPLSSAMAELKTTAATNFSLGMMLVGLAVVSMIPLSGRFVRDVRRLEEGAARLAEGDLEARVEVRSSDELGRLASAFNHMAGQISDHQRKLLEQERLRKEEEISRRLLAAENERRRRELEEAREFQISLLPRELPRRPGLDVAVSMTTATEVGGDYYDFLETDDGGLVFAVGDATGHGAAAGTMVTAVKGLFVGGAGAVAPAEFLGRANRAVHSMGLVRRAMALVVGRFDARRVTLSAAGMPPALRLRAATGEVEEIALPGTPLGARG